LDLRYLGFNLRLLLEPRDVFSVFDTEFALSYFLIKPQYLVYWLRGIEAFVQQQKFSDEVVRHFLLVLRKFALPKS